MFIQYLSLFTHSCRFPGTKKAVSEYGPGASKAAPTAAAKPAAAAPAKPAAKPAAKEEDDDDLDLFGSDDEEDEENEKLKAERVAAYNAKKAASKFLSSSRQIVLPRLLFLSRIKCCVLVCSDDTGICLRRHAQDDKTPAT